MRYFLAKKAKTDEVVAAPTTRRVSLFIADRWQRGENEGFFPFIFSERTDGRNEVSSNSHKSRAAYFEMGFR